MDILKRSDLKELVERDGKWYVSIYMPTHRAAGREQQQDPIRLKNLLAQAEKKLLEYDVRRPDVEEMLRPAQELLEDRGFWQQQGDGLAVFLSEGYSKIYHLPHSFDEMAAVSKSFYVKPILPLLNINGNFYILALSMNQVRLFQGSRNNLSEIELENVPTSMGEALQIEDLQKNLGFHTDTANTVAGTGGDRPAIFYGQGVEANKKDDILQYFRKVDEGLSRQLDDESPPMIIAAVDYLHPIYREASSYRNLLEKGIEGSPDRQDIKELHAEAWKVVEPLFLENQQKAMDRFAELHGQANGLATGDLEEAVKAAVVGRVETLIVPLGVQKWGRYIPDTDSVTFDAEAMPENDDMFNFAAVHTLLNSGNVYAVPAEQFPDQGEIAAILRYAL
jgi:hypothetical protein